MLLTPSPWGRVEWAVTEAIGVVGLLSLLGLGTLTRLEVIGRKWRASTLRIETTVASNLTEEAYTSSFVVDYTGRLVMYYETLLVVARLGYRPVLVVLLTAGVAILYCVLGVMCILIALRRGTPPSKALATEEELGDTLRAAEAADAADEAAQTGTADGVVRHSGRDGGSQVRSRSGPWEDVNGC